jgi:uncharacterized membrane protein (DUF4010 family)
VESLDPYPSLALALLVGLLIGLEREHSRPAPDAGRGFPGGIRTYPIFALLGAVGTMLNHTLGPWPLAVAGLALSAFLAITLWRDAEKGHMGLTSEGSALLTFLLGALALSQGVLEPFTRRAAVVASVAVATTLLLSQKTQLRDFSARVSRDDVIATLKFLVVAVVVLPVLPDAGYGPWGALNPFLIGLMVVLVAGMSFVGYVGMRVGGPRRGLLLTGIVGGLVSSTAVTIASASRSKTTPGLSRLTALATVAASSIMFARVLVMVLVSERSVLGPLLLPLGVTALAGSLTSGVLALQERKEKHDDTEFSLQNPFELSSALKFGAMFVVILLVSRWAIDSFGARGTYLAAVLAGLTDVDAITLSLTNLVKAGQLAPDVAARAIVFATASNTVVKGALAVVLGSRAFAARVALTFAVMLSVGLALAFL